MKNNKQKIYYYKIILIFLIIYLFIKNYKENFMGAINQLHSKGPIDLHLTTNTEKYIYPCNKNIINPFPYTPFIWNNPSRIRIPYYYDIRQYYDDHPHKCG